MVSPGTGTDKVANHHASLIDSVLLPTLNADNTCSSFTLLIDLIMGVDNMPL
jgi:hypothetical protein